MTEDKRPTLSLKRKPGEKTPESGADTARVVRRKQVVNVTTPPAWKVKKEKLARKTEPVAPAAPVSKTPDKPERIVRPVRYLCLPEVQDAIDTLKVWRPGRRWWRRA